MLAGRMGQLLSCSGGLSSNPSGTQPLALGGGGEDERLSSKSGSVTCANQIHSVQLLLAPGQPGSHTALEGWGPEDHGSQLLPNLLRQRDRKGSILASQLPRLPVLDLFQFDPIGFESRNQRE